MTEKIANDFRKQLHISYKKRMSNILLDFSLYMIQHYEGFLKNPQEFTDKWVDSNCKPMGDFSKEDAMKEIEEWSNS